MGINQTGVAKEMAPDIACTKCRWIPMVGKVPGWVSGKKEFLYVTLSFSLKMMSKAATKLGQANTQFMAIVVN